MKKISHLNVNSVAIHEMNNESKSRSISLQLSQKKCDEFQDLLQLVEHNRVTIPDDKKAQSKILSTIFQYESVHEGKKLFNFTLCVETAITRRQIACVIQLRYSRNISTLIILIFGNK